MKRSREKHHEEESVCDHAHLRAMREEYQAVCDEATLAVLRIYKDRMDRPYRVRWSHLNAIRELFRLEPRGGSLNSEALRLQKAGASPRPTPSLIFSGRHHRACTHREGIHAVISERSSFLLAVAFEIEDRGLFGKSIPAAALNAIADERHRTIPHLKENDRQCGASEPWWGTFDRLVGGRPEIDLCGYRIRLGTVSLGSLASNTYTFSREPEQARQ